MAKGEIAQNKKLLRLPQCFQLFSLIVPLFIELNYIFDKMFSKPSAADLLYVGKGDSIAKKKEVKVHVQSIGRELNDGSNNEL